jgi:hypothetical protein
MPRVVLPKIGKPKIWLMSCLPMNWPTLAKKNELELVVEHWQAKKSATIQTRSNLLAMTKKLVEYTLVAIQTHPVCHHNEKREICTLMVISLDQKISSTDCLGSTEFFYIAFL